MEQEVTKNDFKDFYFKYATPYSGWTAEYWERFYEKGEGQRYFFSKPESPQHHRMFILSGKGMHRMVFLTEESEESFFD